MWDIIEVHLMEQNMKPIELAEKKASQLKHYVI